MGTKTCEEKEYSIIRRSILFLQLKIKCCCVWRVISDVQLLQFVDGGMRNDLARHAMKDEGVTGVKVEKGECWAAGG